MDNRVTATSVRKLVDKYFSLQWCRDNLVVPLYIETSLPMKPGIIKIAIANYSYLGTIAEPIKQRISQYGNTCEFVERSQEEIQEILDETIDLRRKKREEVNTMLKEKGYDQIDDDENYKYLVKMPMDSVTEEEVLRIMSEVDKHQKDMDRLQSITREKLWIEDLERLEKELA